MSTLAQIRFHYEQAIRQAERLEAASVQLERTGSEELEALLGETYRAWKSGSSEQFIRKGQKTGSRLQDAARELKKTAETIRTAAEQLRAAEMEARRIANEHR